jgi:hypothetical protein
LRTVDKPREAKHSVTHTLWQLLRCFGNPRQKSGRSPVRYRPWPGETIPWVRRASAWIRCGWDGQAAPLWASTAANPVPLGVKGRRNGGLKTISFQDNEAERWPQEFSGRYNNRDRLSKHQLAVDIRRLPKFPRLRSQPADPTTRDQAPKSFRQVPEDGVDTRAGSRLVIRDVGPGGGGGHDAGPTVRAWRTTTPR